MWLMERMAAWTAQKTAFSPVSSHSSRNAHISFRGANKIGIWASHWTCLPAMIVAYFSWVWVHISNSFFCLVRFSIDVNITAKTALICTSDLHMPRVFRQIKAKTNEADLWYYLTGSVSFNSKHFLPHEVLSEALIFLPPPLAFALFKRTFRHRGRRIAR